MPDFVSELVPADQSSARLGKPSGVMTTAEVLTDDDGNDFGNSSKYWQRTEIDFPGRVSSVLYFRVTMDKLRPFPVKLVLVSPDLDQPIELREMIRPPAEPTDEYPEPFQLTVEAQELSENIALLHVGIVNERGWVKNAAFNAIVQREEVLFFNPSDSIGLVSSEGTRIDEAEKISWVLDPVDFRGGGAQKDFWFRADLRPSAAQIVVAVIIASDDLETDFEALITVPVVRGSR